MPSKRVTSWLFVSILNMCVTYFQKARTCAIASESSGLDATNFWIRKLVKPIIVSNST